MDVLNSTDNLLEDFAGLILIHLFFLDDVVKKLAIFHVFHNKEEMLGWLHDLIKLNDVGMSNKFENMNFSVDSFHIGHINYFFLFKDFNGYFLPC